MKNPFPILFLFCFLHIYVNAQTDLGYYINQAKENSPLIKDNKNQNNLEPISQLWAKVL